MLNDEMLLISRPGFNGDGINVQSTPIIGGFTPQSKVTAPLRCILLLKQSKKTSIRYVDKVESYLRFMRQIISPAFTDKKNRRAVYSMMADFSAEITAAIPVYELEFNLDAESLWRITGELEEVSGRGWN